MSKKEQCAMCAAGGDVDSVVEDLKKKIEAFGHSIVYVRPTEDKKPPFAYTIGLYQKHGFEMIVFGLDYRTSQIILNMAADRIAKDSGLQYGKQYQELVQDLPVMFMQCDYRAQNYNGTAKAVLGLRQVPMVQLVLPDALGNFPRDMDYDHMNMGPLQPILYGA